ncbi:MAG: hypothetical protein EBU46_15030 [Nitrosomonadaceae bacterium]|nr:hypothetical protein [Nitrosomonadaceae bacterium]
MPEEPTINNPPIEASIAAELIPVERALVPVWPFLAGAVQPIGQTLNGELVGLNQQGGVVTLNEQLNANGRQYDRELLDRISEELRNATVPFIGQPVVQTTMDQLGEMMRAVQQRQLLDGATITIDSVDADPLERDRINVDMSIALPPTVESANIDLRRLIVETQPMRDPTIVEVKPFEDSIYEQPKCEFCGARNCAGNCQPPVLANLGVDLGADSTHLYQRAVDGGLQPIRGYVDVDRSQRLMGQLTEQAAVRRARADERTNDLLRYGASMQRITFPQMAAQQNERQADQLLIDFQAQVANQQAVERETLNNEMAEANSLRRANEQQPNIRPAISEAVRSLEQATARIAADQQTARAFVEAVHNPMNPLP